MRVVGVAISSRNERVGALRLGSVLPFLLRARLGAIDRLLELPSDLGYFHVCLVKLIVGD